LPAHLEQHVRAGRLLVNWPMMMFVLSFSVPLLLSALTVLGSSALPVAFAFKAVLSLWL
jgi:hypothetical protein